MKTLSLLLLAIIFVMTNVNGQEHKSLKSPDEQTIVNKKYDEKGNLIEFDSTYIHEWSSDSSFQFSFPEDGFFTGRDFPNLNDFFNNTIIGDTSFLNHSQPSPFDNIDSLKYFDHLVPDSLLMDRLFFNNDSSFNFDFNNGLPEGFDFPNLKELQKQFREQLNQFQHHHSNSLKFNNKEEQKEWEKLMEKHRLEIEELHKKWEQKKKDKQ